MSDKSSILAYNGWDPLEEVWLGDVWPSHFYDDLAPEVRDSFYQLTEWTKKDLSIIQAKLEEFGIVVRRPVIDETNKQLYLHPKTNKLYKPPICPRDFNVTIGDKLYFFNSPQQQAWLPVLENYSKESVVFSNRVIGGGNIVRYGKDIIFDQVFMEESSMEEIFTTYDNFIKYTLDYFKNDYRCHFITNGGHIDGCFSIPHPGLIMTTGYFSDYDTFFPGWERIHMSSPTYNKTKFVNMGVLQKWGIPEKNIFGQFHEYVEQHCVDWVGNFTETYFEINVLMLDEKNMLCMGNHEQLFEKLEQHGITCHVVPFRARTFWDGGIHCITTDIRRKAVCKDYFPDRGAPGLAMKSTNLKDQFDEEYKLWKNK